MLRRGKEQAVSRLALHDADRPAVEAARRDPRATVFMRALTGLPGFREQRGPPDSSFRVWLFQIARNALSNERRRVRRHPEAPIELAEAMPASIDVAHEVALRDDVARAMAQIERLPDVGRRALILRFVHQMSAREIGQVIGRSEGSVRVLIHRSVGRIARQLEHDGD